MHELRDPSIGSVVMTFPAEPNEGSGCPSGVKRARTPFHFLWMIENPVAMIFPSVRT